MNKTLIIDDDRNILTTLEVYLEDKGFEVSLATSGGDATGGDLCLDRKDPISFCWI